MEEVMERNKAAAATGFGASRSIANFKGVDAGATYGCVDWYLYQDTPSEAKSSERKPLEIKRGGPARSATSQARSTG